MGQLRFNAYSVPHTIILSDFNTPHSSMGISKKIQMKQRHRETSRSYGPNGFKKNNYKTFLAKSKLFPFFPAPHGTIYKTDHIIGHKTDVNSYKKI